jgi:hypothetical protein
MDVQEPILMNQRLMMQFSRRTFFASRIGPWISPHGVHPAAHDWASGALLCTYKGIRLINEMALPMPAADLFFCV